MKYFSSLSLLKQGIITLCCLLLTNASIAQKTEIDSLGRALKSQNPNTNSYYYTAAEMAESYFNRDKIDSTISLSNRIANYAQTESQPQFRAIAKKLEAKVLYKQGAYEKAIALFDSIHPMLLENGRKKDIVDALIYNAVSNDILGDFKKAENLLIIAEEHATEELLPGVYNTYAQVYFDTDRTSLALEYLNKALELNDKYKNDFESAITFQTYANINQGLEDYDKSLEFYDKARVLYEKLGYNRGLFLVYNNAGSSAASKGDNTLSLANYKKALEYAKLFDNGYAEAVVLASLAEEERKVKNYSASASYYQESLSILQEMKIPETEMLILENLAKLHFETEEYELSKKYALLSIDISQQINSTKVTLKNRKLLAQIYEQQKDYKNALNTQYMVQTLSDSINETDRIKEIESQRASFDVAQKEQDLKLSEQEVTSLKERQRLNSYIYILGALLLLVVLAFLYRQLKFTQAKKKVLETEKELNALKQTKLEQTVEQKSGQVVNFALHIKEKNELLEALKSKIVQVKRGAKETATKSDLQDIILNINNSISINQNRVKLLSEVDNSNDEFLTNLGAKYPSLTDREKNIAGLIRLNMSSKQIAENLNITERSMNNIRSKIRKKLELEKGTNLSDFFRSL